MDIQHIDELAQQGESYRRAARRRVLVLAAVVTVLLLISFEVRIDPTRYGALYFLENNAWHLASEPFAGVPYQIRVSSDNAIWVSTTIFGGLYRYDGKNWTAFNRHDFHTDSDHVSSFTFQGNELWAVADNDIVHWDGSRWISYPNVFKQADLTDIAAGQFGVMAISDKGELAQFDGHSWKVMDASHVLPGYSTSHSGYPMFGVVRDGLWLSDEDLWRFDGSVWSQEYQGGLFYRLLGVEGDTLWIFDGRRLLAFDTTSDQLTPYTLPKSLADADVYQMVAKDGHYWVGTSAGTYLFDGKTWNPFSVALPQSGGVPSLGFDAQGRLWAALNTSAFSDPSFGSTVALQHTLYIFMPLIIWFAVIWLYFMVAMRGAYRRGAPFRGRIADLLPDIQKYAPVYTNAEKAFRQRRLLYLIVLGVILFITLFNAPFIIIVFVCIVLLDLWCISPSLIRYVSGSLDAANRAYLRRNMVVTIVTMSCFGGLFFVLMGLFLPLVSRVIDDAVVTPLLTIVCALGVAYVLWYLAFSSPILRIYHGALARSDYPKAIAQITTLRRYLPKYFSFMFAHGFILLIAGQYEEAEVLWREILAEIQNGAIALQATCLVNLANALYQQGRFAEAHPLLFTALEMVPEQGLYYRELANCYQLEHVNEDAVFKLSEHMLRFTRRPRFSLTLGRYSWAMTLSVRALALASVRQYEDADSLLKQAIRQGDQNFQPGMATLFCRAAEVDKLQGISEDAINNLRRAMTLDPTGAAGKMAARQLADLSGATGELPSTA